jgi:hypothetical protein
VPLDEHFREKKRMYVRGNKIARIHVQPIVSYATEEDRLAELWRPAKRVALRLALRSTDAG